MNQFFEVGPMVYLASQIVELEDGYSLVDSRCCALVRRPLVKSVIADLRASGKSMSLRGLYQESETLSYQRSAQALARLARQWAQELNDEVVAVYFRDSDARSHSPANDWKKKHDAALRGFELESFGMGVPMIPQPTSEAWLICALKEPPYEGCHRLEELSGSPKAKRPLKREVEGLIGEKPTQDVLCELVECGKIDSARIDMPSFNAFRERLVAVDCSRSNR